MISPILSGAVWYHGYFDHNPAHLLPRPEREVNEEIFNLSRLNLRQENIMENRIEELLKQMTLEEKVSMLAGSDAWVSRLSR